MKTVTRILTTILFIIPTVSIILVYHGESFTTIERIIFSSVTLEAIIFLVLVLLYCKKLRAMKKHISELADSKEEVMKQVTSLRERLELLSATREVCLLLNQNVDFKNIISEVLYHTAQLVPLWRDGKSKEFFLFLCEQESNNIQLKAYMRGSDIFFDKEIPLSLAPDKIVRESIEAGRMFFSTESNFVEICVPLNMDRKTVGALKMKTFLEETYKDKQHFIKRSEEILSEFAKVIALSIKTPDLYTRTIIDGLTALYTKRHFVEQLKIQFELAKRHNDALSLIMIDIDHFKKINDTYGHIAGDFVLKKIATLVKNSVRSYAQAFRYGGEEIAILLPETELDSALRVAERIRRKAEKQKINPPGCDKKVQIVVTISAGVAEMNGMFKSPEELVKAADSALYKAKNNGRNRIEFDVWQK